MKFDNRHFKFKIKYLFLKYTLIPIIVIFTLFLIFVYFAIKMTPINNANKANDYISKSISKVYSNYYNEIERMSKSDLIIEFIDSNKNSNLVYEEFYNFNNKQKIKSVFHIVNTKNIMLAHTFPADIADIDVEEKIVKDIIPYIKKSPEDIFTEVYNMKFPYDKQGVYVFGKAISKDSNITGYIIYQLLEENMQKLIFVPNVEVVVITDQYDRIITATSNVVKGLMNKFIPEYTDNPRYVTINNERYYMKMENPSGTNINVYTLNSVEKNNSIFIYLGIFSMLISLILYVLLDYLANKMSTENTASMDKLVYAVLELQKGNMNSYTDIKTGDEFEILGNQYNLMLDRLNKMIKKNEELSNLRRVQEVKQLQGQFNPHLIFNILETLKYAIVVDQEQAQDIIITLSRLLRYSIKDNGENVLFEDDLEYTKDYLKLHKIRFKERLNYSIKISENLKKAYVPKLILQPIIENSIKHAYKDKEFLNIYIKGDVIFDDLVLEIIDDGSGIEKEQLVSIKEMLEGSQNMTEHIGLYNIHRRLILLYGKGYGLEIESEYGEYTKVRIKVPYVRERYQ